MKINLIAIGTKMPKWVSEGYTEYAQRLPKDFALHLIEIPAEKRTKNTSIQQVLRLEGAALFAHIPQDNLIITLDRQGKSLSTNELADKLTIHYQQSRNVALLIGGPEGISPEYLNQAHESWSLSSLTLPHPLVRILVAEQIYRAWSIMTHHPYHRS